MKALIVWTLLLDLYIVLMMPRPKAKAIVTPSPPKLPLRYAVRMTIGALVGALLFFSTGPATIENLTH